MNKLKLTAIIALSLLFTRIIQRHFNQVTSRCTPCPAVNDRQNDEESDHKFNVGISGNSTYRLSPHIRLRNTLEFTYSPDISKNSALHIYYSLLQHVEVECRLSARVGTTEDGGWDVCLAPPYDLKPGCLVYDFGISTQRMFVEGIADEFGCTVRAFDPIFKTMAFKNPLIHFNSVGVWGQNSILVIKGKERSVQTLSALMIENGEGMATIDILKLDVEGSEWRALETMLSDGTLTRVKQLAMEVHLENMGLNTTTYHIDVLNKLKSVGFRLWKNNWNKRTVYRREEGGHQSSCHEVYYLNTNFMKVD